MTIEGLALEIRQDCGAEEVTVTLDRGAVIETECEAGHVHHIALTEILPYL